MLIPKRIPTTTRAAYYLQFRVNLFHIKFDLFFLPKNRRIYNFTLYTTVISMLNNKVDRHSVAKRSSTIYQITFWRHIRT